MTAKSKYTKKPEVGKMLELNGNSFKNEVLQSEIPVLVDFWAPWCGPCKMIAPLIEEIAADYSGKIKVAKVNVDDNGDLAAEYGIMSIPTVCFFRGGELIFRSVGAKPKKELVAQIESNLNQNSAD
jgi:thioredoxin 1